MKSSRVPRMAEFKHMGNKRVYTDEERAERKKACQKAYCEKNSEKIRIYNAHRKEANDAHKRAWYERNREAVSAKDVERYAEKRVEILKYQASYYENNSDRIKDRVAKWKRDNPGHVNSIAQNRRARKMKAGGELSPGLVDRLMELQRGMCAACKRDMKANGRSLDHNMPLALGGSNTDDNMQLLCPSCNSSKHAKHPIDFMQQRGYLL